MTDARSGGPLAVICGGGSFPAALADAVAARGRRPVMFGIRGWADPKVVERYAHHWIAIGQAGRFFRLAKAENCREVLFIGTVLRPPITRPCCRPALPIRRCHPQGLREPRPLAPPTKS